MSDENKSTSGKHSRRKWWQRKSQDEATVTTPDATLATPFTESPVYNYTPSSEVPETYPDVQPAAVAAPEVMAADDAPIVDEGPTTEVIPVVDPVPQGYALPGGNDLFVIKEDYVLQDEEAAYALLDEVEAAHVFGLVAPILTSHNEDMEPVSESAFGSGAFEIGDEIGTDDGSYPTNWDNAFDPEAERVEVERLEAERLEAERLEAERLEAERLEAEHLEAERLEAERLEAERLEAERLEAERLEAERLEAERLEAERVEAERLEAERVEAERLEAETAMLLAAQQAKAAKEAEEAAERAAAEEAAREQAEWEAADREMRERIAREMSFEAVAAVPVVSNEPERVDVVQDAAEVSDVPQYDETPWVPVVPDLVVDEDAELLVSVEEPAADARDELLDVEPVVEEKRPDARSVVREFAASLGLAHVLNRLSDKDEVAPFDASAAEAAEWLASEREEAERLEAERVEAERVEAERLEAERLEAERVEAERLEAERVEAERVEAERLEAERLEAEAVVAAAMVAAQHEQADAYERAAVERELAAEAERVEAERLAAEAAEAERLAREQADREQADAYERAAVERELAAEAERVEAERLAAETALLVAAQQARAEREAVEAAERAAAEAEARRLEEEAEWEAADREMRERIAREMSFESATNLVVAVPSDDDGEGGTFDSISFETSTFGMLDEELAVAGSPAEEVVASPVADHHPFEGLADEGDSDLELFEVAGAGVEPQLELSVFEETAARVENGEVLDSGDSVQARNMLAFLAADESELMEAIALAPMPNPDERIDTHGLVPDLDSRLGDENALDLDEVEGVIVSRTELMPPAPAITVDPTADDLSYLSKIGQVRPRSATPAPEPAPAPAAVPEPPAPMGAPIDAPAPAGVPIDAPAPILAAPAPVGAPIDAPAPEGTKEAKKAAKKAAKKTKKRRGRKNKAYVPLTAAELLPKRIVSTDGWTIPETKFQPSAHGYAVNDLPTHVDPDYIENVKDTDRQALRKAAFNEERLGQTVATRAPAKKPREHDRWTTGGLLDPLTAITLAAVGAVLVMLFVAFGKDTAVETGWSLVFLGSLLFAGPAAVMALAGLVIGRDRLFARIAAVALSVSVILVGVQMMDTVTSNESAPQQTVTVTTAATADTVNPDSQ